MWRCVICGAETERDDARLPIACGRCICVRCWARAVEDEKPLPAHLRRELELVVNA